MNKKEILELIREIWNDTTYYAGEDSFEEFMRTVERKIELIDDN